METIICRCNDCIKKKGRWTREKKKDAINQAVLRRELSEFTQVELMKELAHRGYSGKLEYPEIRVIDISKI